MKESFIKNKTGILLMIASSVCACIGQLFWKLSAVQSLFILLIGFAFYAVGALIMLVAYKYGSLSVLQPMLSLNYVLSIIFAYTILHEYVSTARIVGVIIVITGVILIGGGDD